MCVGSQKPICIADSQGMCTFFMLQCRAHCVCLLQPGVHIHSLHCAYDRLSCAGVKTVRLYDSHQGSLTKISVSIYPSHLIRHLQLSISPSQSYKPHHTGLTAVLHNLGMIATASKDGTVAIHSPPPGHTHTALLEHHKKDITGLDCSHSTLAVSSSDCTVSLWKPPAW